MYCSNCKINIKQSERFIEAHGEVLCENCSINDVAPCTFRERFIIDLIKDDLEGIKYYFQRQDLFIESNIVSIDYENLKIVFDSGRIKIWDDDIICKVKRPTKIIRSFIWCYKITNSNGELLGYIGKED